MKNYLYYLIGIAGIFFLLTSEVLYHTGSPGGKSGSPGDGGATCTECHGGTATFQEGWISSTIPTDGYVPGETYTITATGTHSGVVRFGFEATAEDGTDAKVGTLIVTNATETQLTNGNSAITHTNNGFTPTGNSKTWNFDWTAPVEGTGQVTFYGAFNAANGNGNNTGDIIYRSEYAVQEAIPAANGITVNLTGMTPHVGQLFEARLIDKATRVEMDRIAIASISDPAFDVAFENITEGNSYWVDFYADHNGNGYYDGIPDDHAWRLTFNNVTNGDMQNFVHNTNFDEVNWVHSYELAFSGMTPHVGQQLEIRLVDQNDMSESGRVTLDAIAGADFDVLLPFIKAGSSYFVDFYADHNGNGIYDAPPVDHAWRIELDDVEGDETASFSHNTTFTDIGWNYRFTLNATGMTPHLGQMFEMRLVNQSTLEEAGRVRLDSISLVDFAALATGIDVTEDYYIDFYADHNGNGMYDPPPTDHAWRLELTDVTGDSELDFMHNTNFTDIQWPTTSVNEYDLAGNVLMYPNPVRNEFTLQINRETTAIDNVKIFNGAGTMIESVNLINRQTTKVNMKNHQAGVYHMVIELENGSSITRRIIKL